MFDGVRYRAYVYINPSQMKVVKTTYSEDGISMDNIYYDNVMHICVYDRKGYHYQALVCIPESPVCNLVNLTISFDGKLNITAAKYK